MQNAADELRAGPVTVRRWRADDVEVLQRVVEESLEHLAPWMPWAMPGYSSADAAAYLARAQERWGTDFDYAIVAPGRAMAGGCSLLAAGPGGLEIGYWVHPRHTRRGYATAVAAALAAEAFRIGAERVEIVHDVANAPSGAVPRRLGFREVERRSPAGERSPGEQGVDVVWRLDAPVR